MISILLLICLLIVICFWLNSKPKGFPPGPPTVPILGSYPYFERVNVHFFFEEARKKFGPIVGLKLGPTPALAVCGPEEVIELLKSEDFSGRPEVFGFRSGKGVMFSDGDHWKEQRRFTLRHLRNFGYGKSEVSDMINEEFEKLCENALNEEKPVQIYGLLNMSAVNVLWEMIAGYRFNHGDKEIERLQHYVTVLFRGGDVTGGNTLYQKIRMAIANYYEFEDFHFEAKLREFISKEVDKHQSTRTDTPRDLIDAYLEELDKGNLKPSFSVKTLIENIRDLFSAGIESSGNTVAFAILYLVLYPEWQKRLYDEIEETIGGRRPSIDDKNKLPLVEAFTAEVMRINSIAPLAVVHTAVRDTKLGNLPVKEGTFCLVDIWAVLSDKNYWKDPEIFRPERFIDESGKYVKDPRMIAFGLGPRICLGENLARNFVFIFLVSLIQRFTLTLPVGEPRPSTVCQPGFTTSPQPFHVLFQKR